VLDEEERRDRLLEEFWRNSARGDKNVITRMRSYKAFRNFSPRRLLEDEALAAGALRPLQ
jgi:hypothetical protein